MKRWERPENKKHDTILNPDQYLSLIADGTDQSAFGLPKFATISKGEKGNAINVRLIETDKRSDVRLVCHQQTGLV